MLLGLQWLPRILEWHAFIFDDLDSATHARIDTAAILEHAHVLEVQTECVIPQTRLKLWRFNEYLIEEEDVRAGARLRER